MDGEREHDPTDLLLYPWTRLPTMWLLGVYNRFIPHKDGTSQESKMSNVISTDISIDIAFHKI